ncbi:MAG: CPBP family intramembrane metalloprotease [Anaerolineae bacterium]|nr:CPBP family intramembrane metalloprotease [Anaerolineae bacterium]
MVKTILSIFWNGKQRRPRAFWRLGLHIVFMIILALVFLVIPIIAVTILVTTLREADLIPATFPGSIEPVMVDLLSIGAELLIVVGAAWLASLFPDRRRFADFGVHLRPAWWIDLGFGLALGAVLMGLIFAVEAGAGWITVTGTMQGPSYDLPFEVSLPALSFGVAILSALLRFVGVGISEEFLSRGYHLKNLAEGLNFRPIGPKGAVIVATLLSSSVFGVLHAGNPNASTISTLNLILAGLFLALGYVLTGELAIPIGLHITWNFFQGNVFGFPVSGTDAGATFIAIEQGGNDLITGGAFGPEAGLIGIAAMILGSVLMILWVRVRHGRVGILERLVTPDLRYRRKEATNDGQQTTSTTENLAA